ncbi:MAG: nucleoside triphosphate pyrophosphohydrolase [Candidatus Gastranaerophilales bacterium]|nr:nucleoside triphosphate pyrophosphohydrolase [Candidatus Gastranaerophilales bacterium]
METKNINELLETIKILRGKNGCDWDRAQTHKSIRQNMLEEAYEAVDAIDEGNIPHLKEELGDVLLQVVLHSQIAADNGEFTFEDVAADINSKLIHRHPHVFGDVNVKSVAQILDNWDKLKHEEKPERKSYLDGVSKAQSALMSAQKLSKKAVKAGFEWEKKEDILECVKSEINEFLNAKTDTEKEMEFGDILFALVNLGRYSGLDAEQCLISANRKFEARFRKMEEIAENEGIILEELNTKQWDDLWQRAKKSLAGY